MREGTRPAPLDYDDPDYRGGIDRSAGFDGCILRDEYNDVHAMVADELAHAGQAPVLDMGCGSGKLGRELDGRGMRWAGVDRSPTQLRNGHGARILGEASRLPLPHGSFGAVAALYMLYHLAHPLDGILEARRVLRPGGVFVTCAPSRFNHSELLDYLPPQPLDTFDAEIAPELVGNVFDEVRVEPWDMRIFRLTTRRAVWEYLVARQTEPVQAEEASRRVPLPLWVRAKGAVVWGRKGS